MGSLSIWHWLIVLAIILLVFGTKRLRNIGSDVGAAIRDFRKSMGDGDKPKEDADPSLPHDDSEAVAEARRKQDARDRAE